MSPHRVMIYPFRGTPERLITAGDHGVGVLLGVGGEVWRPWEAGGVSHTNRLSSQSLLADSQENVLSKKATDLPIGGIYSRPLLS